jgi:hypothetical protein
MLVASEENYLLAATVDAIVVIGLSMMFFFMVRTTPSKETLLYLASYTTFALSYIIFYLHNTVDESERDSTGFRVTTFLLVYTIALILTLGVVQYVTYGTYARI